VDAARCSAWSAAQAGRSGFAFLGLPGPPWPLHPLDGGTGCQAMDAILSGAYTQAFVDEPAFRRHTTVGSRGWPQRGSQTVHGGMIPLFQVDGWARPFQSFRRAYSAFQVDLGVAAGQNHARARARMYIQEPGPLTQANRRPKLVATMRRVLLRAEPSMWFTEKFWAHV
jgi:hypothetical protein